MSGSQAVSAIPGINISNCKERKAQLSEEIVTAAKNAGFFYVTGEPVRAPTLQVDVHCSHDVNRSVMFLQGTELRRLTLMLRLQ